MPRSRDGREHTEAYYQRVDEIVLILFENPLWILPRRCHSLSSMIQKKYKLDSRQASLYVKDAKKLFRSYMSVKDLEEKRQRAIFDREKVIRMALHQNRLQTALNAMKERDVIEGLYIERHEVTGRINAGLGSIPVTEKALELSQSLYREMNEAVRKN